MRIITALALAVTLLVTLSCSTAREAQTGGSAQKQEPKAATVTDPVCGMQIDPAKATNKTEYKGKTYYFCSDYCKKSFDANPEAALNKDSKKKG